MARSGFEMGLAMVLLMTMLWTQAVAQSGCTPVIVSLAPCLTFLTGNSSSAPSSMCCSQLSTVVQTQARCLCTVLNGGASQLGIILNQTQALNLPGACKIQAPPVSQCNAAAAGPATSPAESPKEAPAPTSPATPSTPSAPSDPSPATPSTPSIPSNEPPSSPSTPSVPSNPSPSSPSTPSTPSGSGSKTVPSTAGSTSDGSSKKLNPSLFLFLLFVTSYASTLSNFWDYM